MRIAVQINNYSNLGKTTNYLVNYALERHYDVFFYPVKNLSIIKKDVVTMCKSAKHLNMQKECKLYLKDCDLVLMRNDPPFDMGYITATYMLERCGTLVLNDPKSVRSFPEKFIDYQKYTPDTFISQDINLIEDFCKQYKSFVIKPLYQFGGNDIFKFDTYSQQSEQIIQDLISKYRLPIVVQQFCNKVIERGDKRIIVLDGKILGCFARKHQSGNFIANMCKGGIPTICNLSKNETAICEKIAEDLKDKKIILAGIDMIDEKVIEINVTSIAGLPELELLYQRNFARDCMCVFESITNQSN